MKILLIRMMGLGDVASILIPAVRLIRAEQPQARLEVLTYAAGGELMALVPGVDETLTVTPEQWPNDLAPAIDSFMDIAARVAARGYQRIINLDTWFMPCFLARTLHDAGQPLEGNRLNLSILAFIQQLTAGGLSPDYADYPARYMESSFPNMSDWLRPWWNDTPNPGAYPQYYLNHCCGFSGELRYSLGQQISHPLAAAMKREAAGRRIIAISPSGRVASKQYRHADELKTELEAAGFYVWLNEIRPMSETLAYYQASDLLITVPTATQWLAKLVGCPSLMIPGPLPPSVLGSELTVPPTLPCQYCYQNHCPENLDFACMEIEPRRIVTLVEEHFTAAAAGT